MPEGERLELTEGVEVFFEEGQGLYIWGTLNATGTEEDTVRIRVAEGVEHWKGIWTLTDGELSLKFCRIGCPDTLLRLDDHTNVTIEYSTIFAESAAFVPLDPDIGWSVMDLDMNLNCTTIRSNWSRFPMIGGRFLADSSRVVFNGPDGNAGIEGFGTLIQLPNFPRLIGRTQGL